MAYVGIELSAVINDSDSAGRSESYARVTPRLSISNKEDIKRLQSIFMIDEDKEEVFHCNALTKCFSDLEKMIIITRKDGSIYFRVVSDSKLSAREWEVELRSPTKEDEDEKGNFYAEDYEEFLEYLKVMFECAIDQDKKIIVHPSIMIYEKDKQNGFGGVRKQQSYIRVWSGDQEEYYDGMNYRNFGWNNSESVFYFD